MPELIITEIDFTDVSISGQKLVKAALAHARKFRSTKFHKIPVEEFCHQAGLLGTSSGQLRKILIEARKAAICYELIDISSPIPEDLALGASPFFAISNIDDSFISFEIGEHAMQDKISNMILSEVPANHHAI